MSTICPVFVIKSLMRIVKEMFATSNCVELDLEASSLYDEGKKNNGTTTSQVLLIYNI